MLINDYTLLKEKTLNIANRLSQNTNRELEEKVIQILQSIKQGGLAALKNLTEQFDKKKISEFFVSTNGCFDKLSTDQKLAIDLSIQRVKAFNEVCKPEDIHYKRDDESIYVKWKPLNSVGVYIPGGSAPLLSTVIMTVTLAQVAGVKRIVVVSPPDVHLFILAVCDRLGVDTVLQSGGAQAIGALAYGIEELNLLPVDKIVGPGNQFVTLAKKIVYGTVGIDALYGPSELVIIADEKADAKKISLDLMSQLEHGSGYEATCLFTNSQTLAEDVLKNFKHILVNHPNREKIERAWGNYGIIGVTDNLDQCCELTNLFAPEHLEIKTQNSEELAEKIINAGAIFLNKSNEALGDYLAGPSHCLPTGRSARFSSGLSVMDFMKKTTVVDIAPNKEMIEATALLARMEGLEAHALAALGALE
jgi:histidinol dehydrogenase